MSVKLYNENTQTFEDAAIPKVYDGSTYAKTEGRLYNKSEGAFEDVGWTTYHPGGLVPIMTSNTTPSGECKGGDAVAYGTDYYRAFDDNDEDFWQSSGAPAWCGYRFTEKQIVKRAEFYLSNNANIISATYTLQASDYWTGGWADLGQITVSQGTGQWSVITTNNNTAYYCYRIRATRNWAPTDQALFFSIKFFDR